MPKARCLLISVLIFLVSSCYVFAEGTRYHNSQHMVGIEFPEGWTLEKEHKERSIIALAKKPDGTSISLAVEQIGRQYTAYTFADFTAQDVREYVKELVHRLQSSNPEVKLLDWGVREISNTKAVWLLLTMPIQSLASQTQLTTLHVQIMHKGRLYMITCGSASDTYIIHRPVFEKTVKSLQFEILGINL